MTRTLASLLLGFMMLVNLPARAWGESAVNLLIEMQPMPSAPAVVEKTMDLMDRRLKMLKIKGADIKSLGQGRVHVRLPEYREDAVYVIAQRGFMEMKLVLEGTDPNQPAPPGAVAAKMLMSDSQGRKRLTPIHLQEKAALSHVHVAKARVAGDGDGPTVSLTLTREGAEILKKVTAENIGRRLAVVVDGRVYTAPVIQAVIPSGKVLINGAMSVMEARLLAVMLDTSPLPAAVQIVAQLNDQQFKHLKANLAQGTTTAP